jgi:hypothetical protein
MSYTVTNFKTKKALKEAVAKWNANPKQKSIVNVDGEFPVRCYQPGLGPDLSNYTGKITLEGPHYPKPHSWYAEAELVNGVVVKVK